MSVRPLPYNFPSFASETAKIKDQGTQQVVQRLVNDLDRFLKNISEVCNYNFRMLDRLAGPFFATCPNPPSMSITLNSGFTWTSGATPTLTPVAAQTVGPFSKPVSNPRIDRVVLSNTGVASIVAGTENANPSPPAISANTSPVCQVRLDPSMTVIQQTNLTDERAPSALGV